MDWCKLYFPLAEERNKWKMFSHTPLGPGPEGLFFESHWQVGPVIFGPCGWTAASSAASAGQGAALSSASR